MTTTTGPSTQLPTAGSYWLTSTADAPSHRGALPTARVDVAVVGAGIVGVTTAFLLARAGAKVALLEAGGVGAGTTGTTTAKVTSNHGQVYAQLRSRVGDERAGAYAAANQAALGWIRATAAHEAIACDWRDRDAYTYTEDAASVSALQDEAQAATALGLPATFTDDVPGPPSARGAVRMTGQGEFHPRRWLLGLVALAEAAGCSVNEGTRVVGVDAGDPCTVRTEHAELQADRVVIATQYPILDRSLHFARLHVERSYVVGVPVPAPVDAMLYSIDSPSRSLRSTPMAGGGELALIGGEGHPPGRRTDTEERYAALAATARAWFGAEVTHRWSAQDMLSADDLPYAEPVIGGHGRVWTVTGLRKWGMTLGTAAAHHVAGGLLGRRSEHAAAFDHPRLPPVQAIGEALKENVGNGIRWTAGRVSSGREAAELAPGEGDVHGPVHRRVAAYRDDDGVLHAHAAACTHLGCEVRFNPAERSWDCPCHASRFDAADGRVLTGPAVHGLAPTHHD